MKDFLKKALPWIGTAASAATGTPFPAMAAKAVSAALGGKEIKPDLQSIGEAVKEAMLSPEQLAALKKAEQDFQVQMQQLNFQNLQALEQMAVVDRDSARKREIAVRDRTPKILAYFVLLLFATVVLTTLFGYAKAETVIAGTLIGYCSAKAEQVITYYFGSSSGSAEKSRTLADVVKQQGQ